MCIHLAFIIFALKTVPTISRSYRKKVFWPPAFSGGIGASFKIFEILEYACGFKLGPAANLNQNPFFEIASNSE